MLNCNFTFHRRRHIYHIPQFCPNPRNPKEILRNLSNPHLPFVPLCGSSPPVCLKPHGKKRSQKMRFGKVSLAAIAAASLISAPVVASAATASKSVAAAKSKRAGAASKEESKLGGGSGVITAVLAAAAIIAGIVIAAGNDDDAPTSPG
jgi:hypothetical protein